MRDMLWCIALLAQAPNRLVYSSGRASTGRHLQHRAGLWLMIVNLMLPHSIHATAGHLPHAEDCMGIEDRRQHVFADPNLI